MPESIFDWLADAACRGMDADIFFAERGKFPGGKAQEAIRVCDGCACVRKCLSWALETGDEYAVLGGMTPAQRLKYKRELESTRVARKLNR